MAYVHNMDISLSWGRVDRMINSTQSLTLPVQLDLQMTCIRKYLSWWTISHAVELVCGVKFHCTVKYWYKFVTARYYWLVNFIFQLTVILYLKLKMRNPINPTPGLVTLRTTPVTQATNSQTTAHICPSTVQVQWNGLLTLKTLSAAQVSVFSHHFLQKGIYVSELHVMSGYIKGHS